jgi:hypothetical protein
MMMERVTISETSVMEPPLIRSCYLQTGTTLDLTADRAYKVLLTVLPDCKACPEERRDSFFSEMIASCSFYERDFISHHKCHSAGPATQCLINFSRNSEEIVG